MPAKVAHSVKFNRITPFMSQYLFPSCCRLIKIKIRIFTRINIMINNIYIKLMNGWVSETLFGKTLHLNTDVQMNMEAYNLHILSIFLLILCYQTPKCHLLPVKEYDKICCSKKINNSTGILKRLKGITQMLINCGIKDISIS